MAVVGEQANAVLHTVDTSGKGCALQQETVACELVSESSWIKVECNMKKVTESRYEISYQPTSRGRHQLHIKVEGEHIKGSPFTVTVTRQFGGPKGTIEGYFYSLTSHQPLIIAGATGSISVFDTSQNTVKSFGSSGSGPEEFSLPCDLAVDKDGFLLVADCTNHRIQKFNQWTHKHIRPIGKMGKGNCEFKNPRGIAVHPKNGMVYIADTDNYRIQVLNQNLTFHKILDTTKRFVPLAIAFDSTGNIYAIDKYNHRILVYTSSYC